MHYTLPSLLAVVALAPQAVIGHYNFDKLIVNGVTTKPYEYIRQMTTYNSPVTDVTSNDMRCNVGTLANAAKTKTYIVPAGSTVGFTVADNIGHPGPLSVFMSKSTTANVSSYDGSGDWFRIYQQSVKTFATDSTGVTWLSDGLTSFTFTIPKNIPNGEYLLRPEHLAVHSASSVGGAQFYLSCAQIEITGGSGGTPKPTAKIPGMYSATDPGIYFNLYYPPVKNYTVPGPALYSG